MSRKLREEIKCDSCGKIIKRYNSEKLNVFVNIIMHNTKILIFPCFEKELCEACFLDKRKIKEIIKEYIKLINNIPKKK